MEIRRTRKPHFDVLYRWITSHWCPQSDIQIFETGIYHWYEETWKLINRFLECVLFEWTPIESEGHIEWANAKFRHLPNFAFTQAIGFSAEHDKLRIRQTQWKFAEVNKIAESDVRMGNRVHKVTSAPNLSHFYRLRGKQVQNIPKGTRQVKYWDTGLVR